jgi:hypothetical protein
MQNLSMYLSLCALLGFSACQKKETEFNAEKSEAAVAEVTTSSVVPQATPLPTPAPQEDKLHAAYLGALSQIIAGTQQAERQLNVEIQSLPTNVDKLSAQLAKIVTQSQSDAVGLTKKRAKTFEQIQAAVQGVADFEQLKRLEIFREIHALESQMMDLLTPEGIGMQVRFDAVFAKLETLRELSVKDEVAKTVGDFDKLASELLVADQTAVKALSRSIITASQELLAANAAASANTVMQHISGWRNAEAVGSDKEITAARAVLETKVTEAYQKLKLPLDAIDPSWMAAIIADETALGQTLGKLTALDGASTQIEKVKSDLVVGLKGIAAQLQGVNTAAQGLLTAKFEAPILGAVVMPALGTVKLSDLERTLAALREALHSVTFDKPLPDLAKQFGEPLTTVATALKAQQASFAGLSSIAISAARCVPGKTELEGMHTWQTVQCAGTTHRVLAK